MRILILQDDFPPDSRGGAGVVAFNLAHGLHGLGHDVLVVTTVRDAEHAGETEYKGVRVRRIKTSYPLRFQAYVSLWNFPVVTRVKKILKEFKPDVVHAHNVHGYLSYQSLRVAKRAGARVILTCHDTVPVTYGKMLYADVLPSFHGWRRGLRYNPFLNACIRAVVRSSVDQVLAVSKALKDALEANGIHDIAVMHNGIDVSIWQEPPENLAAFKKIHKLGSHVVLFGGRLSRAKGGVSIIEAVALLKNKIPDIQLLVFGGKDEYAGKMLLRAQEANIAEHIVFTGWLAGRELRQSYHAATVVAVPSLYLDPFPTINLEAFACKKPVVATCFGGSPEIVQDGISGYVVDPNDTHRLAEKIGELLQDSKKAREFGENGHREVMQKFTLARQIATLESYYRPSSV